MNYYTVLLDDVTCLQYISAGWVRFRTVPPKAKKTYDDVLVPMSVSQKFGMGEIIVAFPVGTHLLVSIEINSCVP